MAANGKGEPGLEGLDAIHAHDHQSAGVQNGGERSQPGLIVVLRAKEAEDRIRKVALENLCCGQLPILEQRLEHLGILGLGPAPEQHRGGRGRTGPFVEQVIRASRRERLVENGNVGDDQREKTEAVPASITVVSPGDRRQQVQIAGPSVRKERGPAREIGSESPAMPWTPASCEPSAQKISAKPVIADAHTMKRLRIDSNA